MKPIVKVDRISSTEEAFHLQQLGIDIISISLTPDHKFQDSRYVSRDVVYEIRSLLTDSRLCCELDSVNDHVDLIRNHRFDFIQCPERTTLDSQSKKAFKEAGIGIIYSGIQACHDDDPGWIINPLENGQTICNRFFQIDLLPDVNDSWNFLKEECPKYEECLQIKDIKDIASEFPLIISVDFQPDNVKNVIDCLSNIYGISFTLGENPTRDDFHWISYLDLITILNVLNKSNCQ
jgi:hypothetical protein